MGSPLFLGLGFLLLAVAAPRPNIAMGSDHPAERTHVSSSGRTRVTVYCCKDCAISECLTGRFERFVKIAETENKVFSNEIIDLVTGEKHILMCFRQANTFPEGIYGIFWTKPGGLGHSCAILNSTAFSENGSGNNSTEENKICCEAETDLWKPQLKLKCYSETSRTEPRKSTGNPEFSTSKKNNTAILLTLLLSLVLCAAMVTVYCHRRHRFSKARRQHREASAEGSHRRLKTIYK